MREILIHVINTSDTIKKRISRKKIDKLSESILNLSDKNVVKLYNILNEGLSLRKIKRSFDKAAVITVAIPIPGSAALYYIYKFVTDINYKCASKCTGDEKDKRLCYKKCNIYSIELAISKVKKELNDCFYHKNPKRCEKRTVKYLQDLYETLGRAREKLNKYNYEEMI